MSEKQLCFWSVGDGDYAYMLRGLVHSFRAVGMENDFHVFSDQKIPETIEHPIPHFDKRNYFFKIKFLKEQVKEWDYPYFAYLDADNLFLKKPKPLLPLLNDSPVHCFFENDCNHIPSTSTRTDWWGCPLLDYVRLMQDCGITNEKIYTLNSGFFIVKREIITTLCELAQDFLKYAASQGYHFPDEPGWAYAMQMLCDDPELHLLHHYWNIWCSDWEGVFSKALPTGNPWIFKDYMSKEPHLVNPSIVHAVKSKELLVEYGKSLQIY